MELSTDLKRVISGVSQEKNLDKAVIVDALEQAILHAARRALGAVADLEAHYNEETDEIELFQFRTVVEDEDVADEVIEIELKDAAKLDPESVLGDSIGVKIEAREFGRIAAMSAKQIIIQKVREAERNQIHEEFKDRVGEVLSGNVRRFERGGIIVDLGGTEAIIPSREQVPTERFRVKDRIQGYVLEVRKASRGPQIVMSRGHAGFLMALFEQNVTEIYDGIVSIESAARDPGHRSKIAVYSKDSSIDPVGACVGMKGQRVQAVVQELNGEKIDIIPYDSDHARLVCNALAPAVVSKVIVDEDNHSMEVVVADDQLSLAIGKRGQNVRLAAQLTGWRLDIVSETKLEEQNNVSKASLADIEGVGSFYAEILINEGYNTPQEVAEMNERVLCRMLNLEDEDALKIIENAKNYEPSEKFLSGASGSGATDDETAELLANASAAPVAAAPTSDSRDEAEAEKRKEMIDLFLGLSGVGEAAATALVDAGYLTIGDIIADIPDEVANKTDLPLGVARTIQMAADRHMQERAEQNRNDDE
ncbi:transcription termination factor NusA [Oligoflexaceae bacterium]|nr:transcription termination factor NusA [Oligoflexaceae bacterium]